MKWLLVGFAVFIVLLVFSLASIGSYWSRQEEKEELRRRLSEKDSCDYSEFAESL